MILFLLLYACHSKAQKINGISFVASKDSITSLQMGPLLKTNANYVALMPFGFIREVSSPTIQFNVNRQWFGERKEGIKQYAKVIRHSGLKIMIKPQIWVWKGEFTGHILMDTEDQWKALEDSYSSFILLYAKVAQEINAELFCLGTELEKFVINRPHFWTSLIKEVKKVYGGKITYAANWDEYKRIPFWNQLDYIGIDAYFPLSDLKSPSIIDFELGWQGHKNEIKKVQTQFQKPILFTEFGYRSIDYTGEKPWDSKRVSGQVNLEAQKNGFQAIYNQFWNEDWFAGGFLWKWFYRHDEVGGLENNRFTPQNKPVELLIQQLYNVN